MLSSSHRLPKNQDIRCPFYDDTDLKSRKKGGTFIGFPGQYVFFVCILSHLIALLGRPYQTTVHH